MSSTSRRNWFKSSFSDSSNNCVEVAFDGDVVLVRDDKYDGPPDLQPTVAVPAAAWPMFLESALGAEIQGGSIAVPDIATAAAGAVVRDAVGTALEFTAAEWAAFVAGVRAGEFTLTSV
ncbi:DUF397 domain-containing protein [Nocardia vermiculata]|uniref:DUF397 domain-containing protein n=1 Tax=Nocardia vermiculata TaxID=257274 RepID=A0A846Y9P1_9NOCA|nr:DUF397 domain-containing protein [Nocardia vermiculata]NKY54514.1 DUF397 domain-containing protein [Nocardia vermiculata]